MFQDTTQNQPVTVLGKTFNSLEERRNYFREELRKQLPELKKMEGFPIGEDEDIINLSDPPFYTACPNPWLNNFIAEWEDEKKELKRQGKRVHDFEVIEPYAADVSEGKNNPIYMAHSYHTKVPHPAIMRYILHYTQPGDIVFDGFAGTGMTGVAAGMCENPDSEFKLIIENESDKVLWGKRNAVCSDLSPIACFISSNYNKEMNLPGDVLKLENKILELEIKYKNLYETKHSDGNLGIINYIIFSDVFVCNNCTSEVIYFNQAVNKDRSKIVDTFYCNNCSSALKKSALERSIVTKIVNDEIFNLSKTVPVIINYTYKGKRYEKAADLDDIHRIEEIERINTSLIFPSDVLPFGMNTSQPLKSHGIDRVNQFFSKRSLLILNELKDDNQFLFLLTASMWNSSNLYRWRTSGKGGIMNGVLYIASLHQENNVINVLKNKLQDLKKAFNLTLKNNLTSTHSATHNPIKSNTIDYIFTDPPFGGNIMYSELSFLWESWLKVKTDNKQEAIENKFQNKSILDYQNLMSICFKDYYRVLKPGKWMTVEFSNTSAAVWNGIQTALQNAGFIIANLAALDKKQGSFKAVTTVTAVKQDLVISCYKPSDKFDEKFKQHQNTNVAVWDFVQEHLKHLLIHFELSNSTTAIIERSPKILFDRLIAFYVQKGLPVPIDASKFQQGLKEHFIERDGMFFTNEQVQIYDKKKTEFPEFIQLSLLVSSEQDGVLWLKSILSTKRLTYQDIQPQWMQALAGVRKGDVLPELAVILEENFLKDETGKWYAPDPENEADLEKMRNKRLLKLFEVYKDEATKPKAKLKEIRVEALRTGFKQCYQDKDFKTIVTIGDRIPNNLLMEDEVLLQFYDIASSRI
jgi:DNA modification methylase